MTHAALVLIQILASWAFGLCAGLAALALWTWFDTPIVLNLREGKDTALLSPTTDESSPSQSHKRAA